MDNLKMAKVKNNLRVLRAEMKISQKDLAYAVGSTRSTINRLETGKSSNTDIRLALFLAHYFKKPVEDIFFLENVSSVVNGGHAGHIT